MSIHPHWLSKGPEYSSIYQVYGDALLPSIWKPDCKDVPNIYYLNQAYRNLLFMLQRSDTPMSEIVFLYREYHNIGGRLPLLSLMIAAREEKQSRKAAQ